MPDRSPTWVADPQTMRVIRYDRDYSRRHFLKGLAGGCAAAGGVAPLWGVIAKTGESTAAYPEELRSIEEYTRGRIKTGDEITADNVEMVKDLLEPIKYMQVATLGRRLTIVKSTAEIMKLGPWEYLEATLRNRGQARFDDHGNVVTLDGKPW